MLIAMIADKVIHTIRLPKMLASRLPPLLFIENQVIVMTYECWITLLPNKRTRTLLALNGV